MSTEAPPAPTPTATPTTPAPGQPGAEPTPFMQAVKNMVKEAEATPAQPPNEPPKEAPKSNEPAKPSEAPKPSEPPKPDAVKPEDELPKNFTEAKAVHWNLVNQRWREAEARARTLDAQFQKLTGEATQLKSSLETTQREKEGLTKERETLSKDREDMLSRVERLNIELSPRFQEHFNPQFEQAAKEIKALAGEKGELALMIAQAPPSKWRDASRDELLAGIESEGQRQELLLAIKEYRRVQSEKDRIIANSKAEHAKLVEQEKADAAQRQQQQQTVREARFQDALKAARSYDTFKADGEEGKNAETMLRKVLFGDGIDLNTFVETAARGIDYPRLQKATEQEITELRAKNAELEKAVNALKAGNPSLRGGGGDGPSGKPMDFKGAVKSFMPQN